MLMLIMSEMSILTTTKYESNKFIFLDQYWQNNFVAKLA